MLRSQSSIEPIIFIARAGATLKCTVQYSESIF
jgi:hypothetical protein